MSHFRVALLVLFISARVSAQGLKPDSSFIQVASNHVIDHYNRAIYKQAHVYDGNEYITHDYRIKVHPFYRVDSLQTGTVYYNGIRYDNVQMLYDIVRDELAVQPPEGAYRVRLRNEHLTSFKIGPYQFTRIGNPQYGTSSIGDSAVGVPTGFYEVLHDGRVKALSRRIKIVHEDISQGFYKADYQQKDRFFILKEGVYHEVKTKRSLLTLFPDQFKVLRKHIRSQGLKFNDLGREEAIASTVRYYDSLL